MDMERPTLTQDTTRTWPFFALTLGFTWVLQAPAVLAKEGVLDGGFERWMPLAALGGFGPLIAAMLCARRSPGGLGALFGALRIWRVPAVWYVVALGGLTLVYVCGNAVYRVAGGSDVRVALSSTKRAAGGCAHPRSHRRGDRVARVCAPAHQRRYGALGASLLSGSGGRSGIR